MFDIHSPLKPEELEAVQKFAAEYGRDWKNYLSAAWLSHGYKGRHMAGADTGTLRYIRNTRGHEWLNKFKLPAPSLAKASRILGTKLTRKTV